MKFLPGDAAPSHPSRVAIAVAIVVVELADPRKPPVARSEELSHDGREIPPEPFPCRRVAGVLVRCMAKELQEPLNRLAIAPEPARTEVEREVPHQHLGQFVRALLHLARAVKAFA